MSNGRLARVAGALVALALGVVAFAQPALADLAINVDRSRQQMTVALNGETMFVWPVSTGAPGYDTPAGTFTPFRMEKDHFSKEWDDAPMPHSVFFTMKGHAIHGSNHLKAMGTPASHGCVRLEPKNAKLLFDLVRQEGMAKTRVTIGGETPGAAPQVARRGENYEIMRDENDYTGNVAPRRRVVVREYQERPQYYYAERPYYPRRYGYEPSPYPFYGR